MSPRRSRFGRRSRSSAWPRRAAASRRPGASCCGTAWRTGSASRTVCTSSSRDDPELARWRPRRASTLTDLRRPPEGLNVPSGANLEVPGKIALTVGSDCAIGKMTVSLELDREARGRGIASRFVPTGQTGIAIAGWGISVDAVVADFIAGAAERLVVEGSERGGELLLVEGQGSISHPAYSGVTLGPDPRLGPARFRALPPGGLDRGGGLPRATAAAAAGARRAPRAHLAARAGPRPSPASRSTRAHLDEAGARRRSRPQRPRQGSSPTTRCGSVPGGCSTRSSIAFRCRVPRRLRS